MLEAEGINHGRVSGPKTCCGRAGSTVMNCRAASGQDSSLIDRSGEVHIVSFTMIFIADGWSRLWFVVGHIRETVESAEEYA